MIWTGWYNKIIWAPFFRRGNWMMIFIYGLLLVFFMQTYGGFKVGQLKKGNLIYSQILSVIFANIVTYFQISVQHKHFITPVPLILDLGWSGCDFGLDASVSVVLQQHVPAEKNAPDFRRTFRLSSRGEDECPRG